MPNPYLESPQELQVGPYWNKAYRAYGMIRNPQTFTCMLIEQKTKVPRVIYRGSWQDTNDIRKAMILIYAVCLRDKYSC